MRITLVGVGCGGAGLTEQGRAALAQAELILGAPRLLEGLTGFSGEKKASIKNEEIVSALRNARCEAVCVAFSGDTGFYSGAKRLLAALEKEELKAEVIPGVSSLQYLAARLGCPWQDWRLCSAHGVDCDPVYEAMQGRPVFFLTGSSQSPAALCRSLVQAGLSSLTVTVGENLSYENERIATLPAAEAAELSFAPLSVLLVQPAPAYSNRTPGIPDEEFIRGKTPMTKQEVRAAILSKLAIQPGDTCWDVGAGTGSVSVEMALHAKSVWAVEREADACELVKANRDKFCAWNLRILEGDAPTALEALPAPDVLFVGGSGGHLAEILSLAKEKNPRVRICVSAIALETLHAAMEQLAALGFAVDVTQISVSRAKGVGTLHLLMAQNPIFLITGTPL